MGYYSRKFDVIYKKDTKIATIFPSLIAADPLNLQQEIERLDPHCVGYHLDVMDNHFVPNLTFGAAFINAMTKITRRQLWVHLMVEKPDEFIDTLFLPAGSMVTFHFESTPKDYYLAKRIKEKNWLASIAINPKTNVEEIFPFLDTVDQVLLMSVEPGFYGQSFISSVEDKIGPLIGYRQTSNVQFKIGIDGGINKTNIAQLTQKGADDFAVAAAIFRQDDPIKALQELQGLVKEA